LESKKCVPQMLNGLFPVSCRNFEVRSTLGLWCSRLASKLWGFFRKRPRLAADPASKFSTQLQSQKNIFCHSESFWPLAREKRIISCIRRERAAGKAQFSFKRFLWLDVFVRNSLVRACLPLICCCMTSGTTVLFSTAFLCCTRRGRR